MAAATVLPAPRDIARMVSIQQVLRQFRWRIRSRSRADCGLCHGSSSGTVAYRQHVWHCHRCNEGGDAFSLVRAVNRCDFPQAVRFVAELAGIRLEGERAVIQPKTADTSWTVVPNLWGGIIAPPGLMKSPVISAMTQPLTRIESLWRTEYESTMSDFRRQQEEAQLRQAAWREQYKAAQKRGNDAPVRPDDSIAEPVCRRLIRA